MQTINPLRQVLSRIQQRLGTVLMQCYDTPCRTKYAGKYCTCVCWRNVGHGRRCFFVFWGMMYRRPPWCQSSCPSFTRDGSRWLAILNFGPKGFEKTGLTPVSCYTGSLFHDDNRTSKSHLILTMLIRMKTDEKKHSFQFEVFFETLRCTMVDHRDYDWNDAEVWKSGWCNYCWRPVATDEYQNSEPVSYTHLTLPTNREV